MTLTRVASWAACLGLLLAIACAAAVQPTATPAPLSDDALIRRGPSDLVFPRQPAPGSALSFVPGEILVMFKPGTEQAQIDSLNKQHGATLLSKIPDLNLYHLKVAEADVERVLEGYRSSSLVQAAQRNFLSYP